MGRRIAGIMLITILAISSPVMAQETNESPLASSTAPGSVATPDSEATRLALEILEQGGNAVDAGVAAMFALSLFQPHASGIGGGGFMTIWNNKAKTATTINFREQAPLNTDPAIFYQDDETFAIYTRLGYRSICVPGMVAGAAKALQAYGTKSLEAILDPIVTMANNGFSVSEAMENLIIKNYDLLESNRATSYVFLPDWLPLKKGQTLTRTDLAFTFELLSVNGADFFYRGDIAKDICSELKWNNGILQLRDFENYQPLIQEPVRVSYRNLEIITPPVPSSGGTALAELLSILNGFDIKKFRLNSGPYIHTVAEAMKQVFQDREQYFLGDPKFDALKPASVLEEEYIQGCIQRIDSAQVRAVSKATTAELHPENSSGSHISIVDQDGNAVSISQTIDNFFGSGVTIPKYGILLNNAMYNFSRDSSRHNSLKPGKRPQSSLSPTIVLKNNQPYLILGGSGADRISSMLAQIIVNVVDFKLPLPEAVRAPRFHYNPASDTIEMETRINADDIEYLKKLGHKVDLRSDYDVYFGSAQAILYDAANDTAAAFSDVRQDGVVYIK